MRFHAIACILGLALALAGAQGALSQSRGPPAGMMGMIVSTDQARIESLGSKLDGLAERLQAKSDPASARALAEVKALQARLKSQPSDHDLDNIDIAQARIEQTSH